MGNSEQAPWQIEFRHLMACNCHYGCPCHFNAPPTHTTCEGVLGFQIVSGRYGEVKLDGLSWATVAHWPGPLHEGRGKAVIFIDERANGEQREALEVIASGQGGGPVGILMSTVTNGYEVRSAPVEAKIDGKQSVLRVPGHIEIALGPIRNPVTGAEHEASALMPTGLLSNRQDFYSTDTFDVTAGTLTFSYQARNGLTSQDTWQGD